MTTLLTEADDAAASPDVSEPRWGGPVSWAAVVAVLVPVVVAVLRAIADRWMPVGDNAIFNVRSRDVFTEHHPLLGTWTSASLSVGTDVNNPGPLWFDLLAVPAKVNTANGIAVGVALVNSACVIGIALVAHRLGGVRLAVLSMVAAGGLVWTMGSELLFDPWQPHGLLFPFLLTLFLTWAATAGDTAVLPWLVFTSSLLVQTHVSYAYIVPALVVCGAGGMAIACRRDRSLIRPLRRSAVVAVVVGVVCWIQPLVEQLWGEGTGNLTRLARSSGQGEAVGFELAPRVVAAIVALPGWWSRSTFTHAFLLDDTQSFFDPRARVSGLPSTTAAAAGLLVVTIVLVGLGVLAHRRDDRTGLAAVAVSLAALGAGLLTAMQMPVGVLGIAPHQLRWLWPLSLFLTFAMLAVVSGLVRREVAVGVSLTAVVVLAVAAIPYSNAGAGPTLSTFAHPLVRDLADQLRIADLEGPVLFEYGNQALFEPFSASVQDQLDRLGIEFRAADAATIRQMGDARRADGDESTLVTLRYGAAAFDPVDGVEPIAFASTLEPGDREELARLERQVIDLVTTKGVALSERGQERREAGWLAGGTGPGGAFVDANAVVGGVLARAYAAGSVQVDPGDEALIGRWADLVLRLADETVAVYALPIADG